jgi:hypothetical protein
MGPQLEKTLTVSRPSLPSLLQSRCRREQMASVLLIDEVVWTCPGYS